MSSKAQFRRQLREVSLKEILSGLDAHWGKPLEEWLSRQSGLWGAFSPLADELPVGSLVSRLPHLLWAYPRIENGDLVFHELGEKGWVKGRYALEPDPGSPKVEKDRLRGVLVPAMAIDRRGARLGRGGGYYDRFLSSFAGYRIGIVPSVRFVPQVPVETHDQGVDAVATESELVWFRAKG